MSAAVGHLGSVDLPHEAPAFHRALVVVVVLFNRLGSLTFSARAFLYGIADRICEMQFSRARRLSSERTMYHGACGCRWLQHHVARARVVVPVAVRRQVHRAELPLAQRIVDAGLEAALPAPRCSTSSQNLMRRMPASTMYFSICGQSSRKRSYCVSAAEAHHIFDAGAVVPAAIEDHDLARRRGSARCSAG